MTIDYYAELHGDKMDQPDGSYFHDIRTKGDWGVASGVDAKGQGVLRVFEIDADDRKGLSSKSLGEAGKLESISGNRHELPLPEGVDAGMMADGVLQRLYQHGGQTSGQINMHATRVALNQFGVSDTAASETSYRRTYPEVIKELNRAFEGKGPSAFADKPSKHLAVLENLKTDLGVGQVVDASIGSKPAASASNAKPFSTSVPLGKLGG